MNWLLLSRERRSRLSCEISWLRHLALHNTIAWPVLPGRRRIHGGVKKWEVAQQDIIRTLKERRYCSTMFDYYAMPVDWPGRKEAATKPWPERAGHVEGMIHADIVTAMGDSFGPKYFIPYVELHEFEALAFADVENSQRCWLRLETMRRRN